MVLGSAASSCLCGSVGGMSGVLDKDLVLFDEATDLPACNYDENPTPLYKAMEQAKWVAVSRFLKTGVWPGDFFSDKRTPKEQARTWIHRYEDATNGMIHELRDDDYHSIHNHHHQHNLQQGIIAVDATKSNNTCIPGTVHVVGREQRRLRWRQLPLHAALIFMAPPYVVKQLIEAFPYALRCPDDKGMLPLHLAFRQAVPDDILTILLRLFPNGTHVRDHKGRLPVECVRMNDPLSDAGEMQQPVRGMIIQSIMQQSKDKYSKQQQDTIQSFQKDIGALQAKMESLEKNLQLMDAREQSTRQELASTLEQLQALKKNHRKLQELQRFALDRQSSQDAIVKQSQSFQQRIIDQLDMNINTPRGGGGELAGGGQRERRRRSRSNSRGRTRHRDDDDDDHHRRMSDTSPSPRDRAANSASPAPFQPLLRQGSRAPSRLSRRSSFSRTFLEDDDSRSFSSGISSVPNASTAFTAKSVFTAKSALSPTNNDDDDDGMDADTDDRSTRAAAALPLHRHQSIFDRRQPQTALVATQRRSVAKATHPVNTASNTLLNSGGNNNKTIGSSGKRGSTKKQVVSATTTTDNNSAKSNINCVGDSPSALDWNFSFTPAFLRPLSVEQL